ncbi:hypothetical protein GLA29479_3624 [Lysobacter antibioticus]|nr:hypothetical protein GLA29479_3624 [Lysobacter antibioticus]
MRFPLKHAARHSANASAGGLTWRTPTNGAMKYLRRPTPRAACSTAATLRCGPDI